MGHVPHIGKSIPNPIHWATDFEKPSLFLGGLISSKTKTKRKKNKPIGTAPDLLVLHWSSSIPNPIHWLLIWDLWALGLLACFFICQNQKLIFFGTWPYLAM